MVHSSLAFFSTNELPVKLKELEHVWEHFMIEDEASVSNNVRLDVLESWQRCQAMGVDPLQKQTKVKLSESQLLEEMVQSKFYQISLPIIEEFHKQIKGTGHLITLGDHEGKIIHLQGDTHILNNAEQMNFVIGSDWSEQAAGSNAIGTSLAAEKPIQILSSEHYCQGVHSWACSSAPIRDPRTKRILGAVDLTGPSTIAQPHSLSLVQYVSSIIEQDLFNQSKKIFRYLQLKYDEKKNKKSSAHVIILDEMLNVVHGDNHCLQLLNIKHWNELWNNKELRQLKPSLLSKNSLKHEWEWEVLSLDVKIFIRSISLNDEHIGFALFVEKIYPSHPSTSNNQITLEGVVGESFAMKSVIQKVQVVADKNVPVLITGESGTGKEIFSRNIHLNSRRKDKPFIAINCGAIPENLITSELFGYVGGAFTGGDPNGKKGKFEEANGGTILLDEIGEMPLDLQVHLLRFLQEKEIVPVGAAKPIPIDVRIIAATNKDLKELIAKGLFRSDLYYRLNVVGLHLPPLRKRQEDIARLCEYFAKELAETHQREIPIIDEQVLNFFHEYNWPGNIRELINVMEYAILFSDQNNITLESLPASMLKTKLETMEINNSDNHNSLSIFEEQERSKILQLIEETNGNLSEVARRCNIARTTLYRRMKKYNINKTFNRS